MKKLYLYLAIALPLMGITSCAKADSAEAGSQKAATKTVAKQATKSKNTSSSNSSTKKKAAGNSLSTTQSQLDFMKNSADWAKYESGILPQMAEDAPSYCGKLLKSKKKYFVIVDKGKMHLFLYDKYGNVLKKFPIACAKNYGNKAKKGDSRTNEGYFEAMGVYDSREWKFTNDNGYTSPAKGVYGPWFIRVVRPIGIHGTSSPGSIGKRCSHGCIRVNNENIKELIKYVDAGTPIIVSPGPKDMAVNAKEGRPTLAVATEPGTPKAVPGKDNVSIPVDSGTKKATQKNVNEETPSQETSPQEAPESAPAPEAVKETAPQVAPAETSAPAKQATPVSEPAE